MVVEGFFRTSSFKMYFSAAGLLVVEEEEEEAFFPMKLLTLRREREE